MDCPRDGRKRTSSSHQAAKGQLQAELAIPSPWCQAQNTTARQTQRDCQVRNRQSYQALQNTSDAICYLQAEVQVMEQDLSALELQAK